MTKQKSLEEWGTSNSDLADGHISYFRHGEHCVMVVATLPTANEYLTRLNSLRVDLQAYSFERKNKTFEVRFEPDAPAGSPFFIYFVAKDRELQEELESFVEFIRQNGFMKYPYISNMSWFAIKKA